MRANGVKKDCMSVSVLSMCAPWQMLGTHVRRAVNWLMTDGDQHQSLRCTSGKVADTYAEAESHS